MFKPRKVWCENLLFLTETKLRKMLRDYLQRKMSSHVHSWSFKWRFAKKRSENKKSVKSEKLKGRFKVSINVQSYQFESSFWPHDRWNEFQPQLDPEQDKTAEGNKWINTFKELTFHSEVLQDVSYQFWQAC